MRLRNKTRDGMNWDRGVGTDEESRVGKVSSVEERSIGLERSDDFLRRTGPKLEEGRSAKWRSGIRDKSAISHGLVRSGAAWRVDIQGRWSKAWSGALTRPLALGEVRRRFGCCELGFERLLGDDRQGYGTNRVRELIQPDESRAGTHRSRSHARLWEMDRWAETLLEIWRNEHG
jgi:hypothetical protein